MQKYLTSPAAPRLRVISEPILSKALGITITVKKGMDIAIADVRELDNVATNALCQALMIVTDTLSTYH